MDFSDAARFARHFDDPARDAWQKPTEVLELLEVRPGQTVVDVGAGTGYFVRFLAARVGSSGSVLALDSEPSMVEHLKQRAAESAWSNVRPRTVPAGDAQLAPNSVHRILIVNTWHHIDNRSAYAERLRRALHSDGLLLIVDFTLTSDLGPPLAHRLPAQEVVRELEAGGLRAEILSETLPKQYAVRAAKKL